jgi:hypothetical protein
MAAFDEQVLHAWEEWEGITGADANDPDEFVKWAMQNRRLLPRIQDVQIMLRKQVTSVLRQATRRDEAGFSYRAKQCVLISENAAQYRLWFDTDKGGTTSLRQKAVRQRRDATASDVYRAVCDVEHMSKVFPFEQLSFPTDFTEDVAEKRAEELAAEREKRVA